nr:MAG TPA: DNA polymerase II small subunit [Caudoviricetes sp.]
MKFKRNENETDLELIYRVCSNKDVIGTWEDVAVILNQLLHKDYTSSAYRKKFQSFKSMLEANSKLFTNVDNQLEELEIQRKLLQKERVKLRTEKLEYNRWLREEARDEMILENIIESIKSLQPLHIPDSITDLNCSNKEYCLCIGDEHFGVDFEIKGLYGEVLNSYSPEEFERRMWKLRDNVISVLKKDNVNKLKIYDFGDNIDGLLRVSQLCKLRYGVIEQSVKYANFISNWLNSLSEYFNIEYHIVVDGNHSQLRLLGQPKNTFTDENMSKVINTIIKERLNNNSNVEIIINDTGMIFDNVCGYTILGIHGEVKSMSKAISEYEKLYGININYLIGGHLHHYKAEEIGFDCEIINIPSIIGIDDYSVSLRKCSNPAAKLLTFEEENGKILERTIKLY